MNITLVTFRKYFKARGNFDPIGAAQMLAKMANFSAHDKICVGTRVVDKVIGLLMFKSEAN